ncbi:UNVERIFIED_CONTAM: Rhomboid-like protein 19 [Sesamum indicum]
MRRGLTIRKCGRWREGGRRARGEVRRGRSDEEKGEGWDVCADDGEEGVGWGGRLVGGRWGSGGGDGGLRRGEVGDADVGNGEGGGLFMAGKGTMSIYTGFTRLCKGLAVVLIGGHIVVQILPTAVSYLALIPAKTIPFAWNLITAGYIEQSIIGVVISTVGLLFIGKLLEPIWGSREFLKFIFVVNFLTSVCVFITAISLYYVTRQELYLRIIDPVATIFERMFCGRRSETPDQTRGYTLGGASLPGSDSIDASRRRERGARALEERLAERLAAAAARTDETRRDASENV